MKRVRSQCVQYVRPNSGGTVFPIRTTTVAFWGGGDMAYTSEVLGLGAHFNRRGYNCCWCEVHTDHLSDKTPSTQRTLRRLYNLAHLPVPSELWQATSAQDSGPLPFICPGCHCKFTENEVRND